MNVFPIPNRPIQNYADLDLVGTMQVSKSLDPKTVCFTARTRQERLILKTLSPKAPEFFKQHQKSNSWQSAGGHRSENFTDSSKWLLKNPENVFGGGRMGGCSLICSEFNALKLKDIAGKTRTKLGLLGDEESLQVRQRMGCRAKEHFVTCETYWQTPMNIQECFQRCNAIAH